MIITPRFTAIRNAWHAGYLFGQGQEGAILRPEPPYLFTDSARTTLITAPGDPVGGATDLSGNGNHWAQPSDPDRPVYGIVPATGRRNLLEYTEEFDNAYWVKPTDSAIDRTYPDNGVRFTADESFTSSSTSMRPATSVRSPGVTDDNLIAGYSASLRASVKINAGYAYFGGKNGGGSRAFAVVIDSSGSVVTQHRASNVTINDFSVTPSNDDGWFDVFIAATTTSSDNAARTLAFGGSASDNIATAVTGPFDVQCRFPQYADGSEQIPYQRVGNQFDVTEQGVRSLPVAHFNYTNHKISTDLPAGTYTICIAGTNGSWFDEVEHAGGTFDLGPTTYTGGPANLLEAMGLILEVIPREGALSDAEKARTLSYFESLGAAPGEVTL